MRADSRIFVDTNVLVYARDLTEGGKQERAAVWLAGLWRTRRGVLSMQVLQEYYVTVTGKLRPGLPREEARRDVRAFGAWNPLGCGPELFPDAWAVQDRYGLSFWDALIVTAAKRTGARHLLTEDLQQGRALDGIEVLNPFLHDPLRVLDLPPL